MGKAAFGFPTGIRNIAEHADDLAVIRSCWADGLNHVGSVCQMNTGAIIAGRPSLGAWLTYGLGTANENLPVFVILTDNKSVVGGAQNWSSGFLPASYQGTLLQREGPPILHLKRPERIGESQQRGSLDLLGDLNRHHAQAHPSESELNARLESYELAYRMQTARRKQSIFAAESDATKKMYGLDDPATEPFGKNCLMARRLVERGVRFVELYCGSGSGWDAHQDMEGNHSKWCRASDKPIAGLLADLKGRGLLKDTLVVWGGEFGRTPFNEKGDGRDHNPWGFTMWMAGGGIKAGQAIGTTDEIGLRAVDKPYHVHDLHATDLEPLGPGSPQADVHPQRPRRAGDHQRRKPDHRTASEVATRSSFRASCIEREPLALVITPNCGVPIVSPGYP